MVSLMFGSGYESGPTETRSPKSGHSGHHIPQILEWGHSRNFEHKILTAKASYCITDSLSHTTCVETNERKKEINTLNMETPSVHMLNALLFLS